MQYSIQTGLVSWRQVLRFARLPRLQQLHLTDNRLADVWPLPPPPAGAADAAEAAAAAAVRELQKQKEQASTAAAAVVMSSPMMVGPGGVAALLGNVTTIDGDEDDDENEDVKSEDGSSSSESSSSNAVDPADPIACAVDAAALMLPFGHLFYFSLSGTCLNSWASIDALNVSEPASQSVDRSATQSVDHMLAVFLRISLRGKNWTAAWPNY